MSQKTVRKTAIDPRRYHEAVTEATPIAQANPVCLYLETTNRCNLLCTTCPRTYDTLEPEADMSWELFRRIVDQLPEVARVVLHGVGEPMLVKELPRMIRYLKARGAYVLFNTNGTMLTARRGRELCETGLDELRVSLDAADAPTFLMVRGRDHFHRIVRNVRSFTEMQEREAMSAPRVSLWLTGLKQTITQLADFVRVAHTAGIKEVYLQRLVFFDAAAIGMARPDQALFERLNQEEAQHLEAAQTLARSLGITFNASGATGPQQSLTRRTAENPWSLCRRPWTLMYFTAHGKALPCCIAPFSMRGYSSFTLGDATQESLREIWNGVRYQEFRRALLSEQPPPACARCGLRWSL